jgi:hypothetical protein
VHQSIPSYRLALLDPSLHFKPLISLCPDQWEPVIKDKKITWDLEQTSIEIKTDSTIGSNELIRMVIYDNDENWLASIVIKFAAQIELDIGYCTPIDHIKLQNAPLTADKVWLIVKTETTIHIYCNGVHQYSMTFAESEREDQGCVEKWQGDKVGFVRFHYSTTANEEIDTASDFYRPGDY